MAKKKSRKKKSIISTHRVNPHKKGKRSCIYCNRFHTSEEHRKHKY